MKVILFGVCVSYKSLFKSELKSGAVNYGGIISCEGGEIRFTSSSLADRKNLQGNLKFLN